MHYQSPFTLNAIKIRIILTRNDIYTRDCEIYCDCVHGCDASEPDRPVTDPGRSCEKSADSDHWPVNRCISNFYLSWAFLTFTKLFFLKCTPPFESVFFRDAPVDRPKIGTGRFLLIMRDRQPAGFCIFFGRFFRKCEHVICVEDIRQEHNKHRKTDTMKRTAVGVTLLAHK